MSTTEGSFGSAEITFAKKPLVFYEAPGDATAASQYGVLFRTKSALPAGGRGHRRGTLWLAGEPADIVEWAGSVDGKRRCFQAWFTNDQLAAGSPLANPRVEVGKPDGGFQ